MRSPVGHIIAASAVGVSCTRNRLTPAYVVFCIFSGIAPDLDLLIGWVLGDINGYHHLGSHSVVAALLYGLLVYMVVRVMTRDSGQANGWAVSGTLMYASHVLLDYLAADSSPPFGLQLLWPFSNEFYISPVSVFMRFMHDTQGADMWGLISGMFIVHNFYAVVLETVLLLPLLLVAIVIRKRTHSIP